MFNCLKTKNKYSFIFFLASVCSFKMQAPLSPPAPSEILPGHFEWINPAYTNLSLVNYTDEIKLLSSNDRTRSINNRKAGVLVGLVLGDATGTQKEFCPRTFDEEITSIKTSIINSDELILYGKNNLKIEASILPGDFTDDASMALCLGAALVNTIPYINDNSLHNTIEYIHRIRNYFTLWAYEGLFCSPGLYSPWRTNIQNGNKISVLDDNGNVLKNKKNEDVTMDGYTNQFYCVADIGFAIRAAIDAHKSNGVPEDLNGRAPTNGCAMRNAAVPMLAKNKAELDSFSFLNVYATHPGSQDNIALNNLFSNAVFNAIHYLNGGVSGRKKALILTFLNDKQNNVIIDQYIKPLLNFMQNVSGAKSLWSLSEEQKAKLFDLRMAKRLELGNDIFDASFKTAADGQDFKFGSLDLSFDKQGYLISSSGGTAQCLVAAIWSILTTNNAYDAILRASNLCDDADTVAAITGQMAGAIYGLTNFAEARTEEEWNKIPHKEWFFSLITKIITT